MTVLTLSIVLSLSVSCLAQNSSTLYTRINGYCPHYEIGNYSPDTYISCAAKCRLNANCATFCYSESFEKCTLYRRKAYVPYPEKGDCDFARNFCLEKNAHMITPTTELEMEEIFEVATAANVNHVGMPTMYHFDFKKGSDSREGCSIKDWKIGDTEDIVSDSLEKYWGHLAPICRILRDCVIVRIDELIDVQCYFSFNAVCQEHAPGSCHQEDFDESLGLKCFKPTN